MEESKKGTFERPIIQCDYSGAYYASSLLRVYVLVLRVPWLKMTKRLEYCYLHAIYIGGNSKPDGNFHLVKY